MAVDTTKDLLTYGLGSGDATAILTWGLMNLGIGGGDGGNTGGADVVILVRGPLQLRSNGRISEEGFTGDTIPMLLQFCDDTGKVLSLDGASLVGQVSQFGSVVSSGIAPADGDTFSVPQMFRLFVPLPSTQGVARLAVTRTAGSDIQTASMDIVVKAK